MALTQAFITGLQNQETHQQLAERKGLHVVKFNPNMHFFPEIVASPVTRPIKKTEEIEPIDVYIYFFILFKIYIFFRD